MGLPGARWCFVDRVLHVVIALRIYFVVLGLAAVLGAERLSTLAATPWSRVLQREATGLKRVYRLVFIASGVVLMLFGLPWPPAWSDKLGVGERAPAAGMASD